MKNIAVMQSGRGLAGALLLLVVLAGCASGRPAPVVNRTPVPAVGDVPVAPTVTLPAIDPASTPASPVTVLPSQDTAGPEVNPIRSNSIGSISTPGTAAGDGPGFKTGPKGLKRPFGELASVDARTTGSVPVPVNRPPQPVSMGSQPGTGSQAGTSSTQPAVSAPPAIVASTRSAGGSGVIEGISFDWPLKGKLLQGFEDTSGKGVSLAAKSGAPVAASADGKVIFSGAGPKGYGNLVIVKHSAELLSVYANNRSLAVKEGQSVKRGEKIAEVGAEKGGAPQLHFEIRQQGKPIDPMRVLPAL